MTQALITVNGVDGSNNNLPINTLVNLSNHDAGGEVTYLWAILDQPAGTADNLSATNIKSPTFTPKKEGTYLLKLTVNATLADEHSNTAIVGIRQLKSFMRDPAAGETTEDSAGTGWKTAITNQLQKLDALYVDANHLVAQVPDNTFAVGQIVKFNGTAKIKTGLPGEETVMTIAHANGNDADLPKRFLGIISSTINGLGAVANDLVRVRVFGLVGTTPAGAPASGDPVYLDNAGAPSLAIVTSNRVIGRVLSADAGGTYRWFINDTRGPF